VRVRTQTGSGGHRQKPASGIAVNSVLSMV